MRELKESAHPTGTNCWPFRVNRVPEVLMNPVEEGGELAVVVVVVVVVDLAVLVVDDVVTVVVPVPTRHWE
jgi:hypothetical protein